MRCKTITLFCLPIFSLLMSCTKTVKTYECEECEVLTEKGIPLDAKIYKRKSSLTNNRDKINTYEYTLVLGSSLASLEVENYWLNPNKLIFYPEFFLVALPNYDIHEDEGYILHKNIEKERFVIIKADTALGKKGEDAIYKIEYSPTQIKFNSFGKIKAYGNSVIIKLK